MKLLAWLLLLVVTAGSAEVLCAEPPPDTEIEKLIVGKWIAKSRSANVAIGDTTITYRDDGTFVSETPVNRDGTSIEFTKTGSITIRRSGTWKVANSRLTLSFDKGDPPIAVSRASVMVVVEINGRVFRLRHERGKIVETMSKIIE